MAAMAMIAAGIGGLAAPPAQAASVTLATPQGEVAQVRQIVLRFDVPVVRMGDPGLPDPARLACSGPAPAGSGRWVDTRQWVFDLREALPAGQRCAIVVRDDFKPLDGALAGRKRFEFQTGGPAVDRIEPGSGSTIEEDQHFLVRTTGPVAEASLAGRAWCEAEGIGERLAVRVVRGEVREALLRERPPRQKAAARTLLLTCARPLPAEARVRLVWGAGIASAGAGGAGAAITTRSAEVFEYTVRRRFQAEFSCERERAQAPCLPIRPLRLQFSEPVSRALAQQVRLKPMAGGEALAPVFDRDDREAEVSAIRFPLPLAENARYQIEVPVGLKDVSGRQLSNAGSFPLAVATGSAPPIARFAAAPFGILEHQAEPVLPVTLRHVQGDLRPAAAGGQVRVLRLDDPAAMLKAYAQVLKLHEREMSAREAGLPESRWTELITETDARGREVKRRVERMVGTRELSMLKADGNARRLDLPALQGGDPRPFEVVGIPLPQPGLHVVEIESQRLGHALLDASAPPRPMYVRTAALVTNLAVHTKLAREASLVWVTTLDRARPVPDAEVQVFDCQGKALWSGRTDAQGRARIAQALEPARGDCLADMGFFVSARKTGPGAARGTAPVTDVSFAFTSWNRGIDPWRFNLPLASPAEGPTWRAHTVFDRTLLRAGETVSMKHFIRAETATGLAPVPPAELPGRVRLTHEGSGQELTVPLQWAGTRSATSRWAIPPTARLGLYRVSLEREGAKPDERRNWDAGDFRVEEFRVPLVDARLVPPAAAAIAPGSLGLGVQMAYLAGGAMGEAPLQGTAQWGERVPAFAAYPDFSFQPPRDLQPGAPAPTPADDEAAEAGGARLVADRRPLKTDAQGVARWDIDLTPVAAVRQRPGELRAELSYTDPNGEIQTVTQRVDTWPSALVLGLRSASWASERGRVRVSALALGLDGKPRTGQALEIRGRLAQTITTRKRMVGGFYAYDNRTEVQDLGVLCSGRSDAQGLLACDAALERAGEVELIAQARDADGRLAQAATSVWISQQGELWFAQDNDDRIDVLPEKKRYAPGETARLQVRMPFREATVLVGIEREGILETRVHTLRGRDPTVELKIEPTWGPNVYVSVLAVRGRIREVPWYSFFSWGWKEPLEWARAFWHEGPAWQAPTAMVDLSKPAHKFGVAALQVGTEAHQLAVKVTTDQPEYRIRGKATARVQVTTPDGKPAAGAELAFAAVDEGLLALRDNASWDLLAGLLQERAWGVETATAQSEVIGRRHYGRKAVAAGGGGGRAGARELLDTLLLWQPRVALDDKGEASITVPLNDSLTAFRLVAVADADQRFGHGHARIRVTQDLQLLAGLPTVVREGDRFQALVTVRNTTARPMQLRATLAAPPLSLEPQVFTLPPSSARELSWAVEVPTGITALDWEAAVEETGGEAAARASDRLRRLQRVAEAVPMRVMQATLQQLDGRLELPLGAPAGAPRAAVTVQAQASLATALPGVRRYFEHYPYTCLEQQASKAIGLRDAEAWARTMASLPGHLDADGLAAYFPPRAGDAAQGSDRLSAYLLSAAHEAGWPIPEPALASMLQGLQAFVTGRIERRFWAPRADGEVRRLAALAALARHGKADARWLGTVRTTPDAVAQWPTAALLDWLTVLQRLPAVPERAARLAEAQQQLRARLTLAGTTLRFSREDDDFWWWLMDSADANAARLILALAAEPAWREDMPRLVAGHLGRQREGRWLTTTANAWSVLALERFAQRFESVPVAGRTTARLGDAGSGAAAIDWTQQPRGASVQLPWAGQAPLIVTHEGAGKPWIGVQAMAAVPLTAPLRAGYSVQRSVQPVQQKAAGPWSRGDVMRVRLEIDALADMNWVVVSDPVPAGASILGSGLGRDSAIATAGERREGTAWPAYEERAAEAFRSYFAHLPRGRHVVEYSVRLNNPGRFVLPPTRVEAMYAPESFGEAPNAPLEVRP